MQIARIIIFLTALIGAMPGHTANLQNGSARTSLPNQSWTIPDFTADSVKKIIESKVPLPIEGIWSDPQSGAEVAIVGGTVPGNAGTSDGVMLMVALRTPMVGVRRGTVVGWIAPTARSDYYEARIFTHLSGDKLTNPKAFFVHYSNGRLGLTKQKKGLRINLLGLLPFMYRRSLRQEDNTPKELSGYVRIWPVDLEHPAKVRYL